MDKSLKKITLLVGCFCWFLVTGCVEKSASTSSVAPSVGTSHRAVIGGKQDMQNPAVGALAWYGLSICSGTLIAPRVVLTAAHCIDFAKALTFARMEAYWSYLSFRIERPVTDKPEGHQFLYYTWAPEQAAVHPQWETSNDPYAYDLGLILLSKPVPSEIAQPIPFQETPLSNTVVGQAILLMGYGQIQTMPFLQSTERKHSGRIPIESLTSTYVRIGGDKAPRSCYGDSGGPYLLEQNGSLKVVAVNSHGAENRSQLPGIAGAYICDGSSHGIRTDVYTDFINSWLRQHGYGSQTCRKNSDCGFCGECSEQSRCVPKSISTLKTTCRPCTKDSDCDAGVCALGPNGFRCFQPCAFSQCCQAGSQCTPDFLGSTTKHCKPVDRCPDVTCQSNAECGKRGVCEQGVCRISSSPRQPKLCKPCQQSSDCGPQSVCYGPVQDGRCLQPCEQGVLCPDGFVCRSVFEGMPKQCTPKQFGCLLTCQSDNDCSQEESCQKGHCYKRTPSKEGELCHHGKCEAPLVCSYTRNGYVCMRSCGPQRGLPGSPCQDNNTCTNDATCFGSTEAGKTHVCLHTCQTNDDCKKGGGSRCFQGYCLCASDKDCETGHQCNKSTGLLGACAPQQAPIACGEKQQCLSSYNAASYCVSTQPGRQALGETCDAVNRCIEGLQCFRVSGGALCLQPCSKNSDCTLGRTCWGVNSQEWACLCTQGSCPKGRTCVPVLATLRGVCKTTETPECLEAQDCPTGYQCKDKKCILPGSQEPASESTNDGGLTESTSPTEPSPETIASEPIASDASNEAIQESSSADKVEAPGRGCGCTMSSETPFPSYGWLWLLGVAVLVRRKRMVTDRR